MRIRLEHPALQYSERTIDNVARGNLAMDLVQRLIDAGLVTFCRQQSLVKNHMVYVLEYDGDRDAKDTTVSQS
jgi:hypothetical protein